MKSLTFFLANPFVEGFNEGGPFIMSLILICFLASIFFVVKSFINLKKDNHKFFKSLDLVKEFSLLAVVIGVFGSLIGLVEAFDSIEADGNVSLDIFSAGLKVSFLTIIFGTITFIIARIAIVILKMIHKDTSVISE